MTEAQMLDVLVAGGGYVGHGEHGDDGLARADIALDQPAHALTGGQVSADFT